MRRRGHRIASLLAAAVLALPAAASGQSAGDEQYEDPFAPEQGQTGGGSSGGGDTGSSGGSGSSGGGSSGGGGTSGGGTSGGGTSGGGTTGGGAVQPAPAPAAQPEAAPPAATTTTTTTASGQQLARTGADAGLLALGGAVLLAGGVALRVTISARGPRRR